MGLGLSGAYGAKAGQDELRNIELRALKLRLIEDERKQQEFQNAIALRQIAETEASGGVSRDATRSGMTIAQDTFSDVTRPKAARDQDLYNYQSGVRSGLTPTQRTMEVTGLDYGDVASDAEREARGASEGRAKGLGLLRAFESGGSAVEEATQGPNSPRTLSSLREIDRQGGWSLRSAQQRATSGIQPDGLEALARQAAERPELLDQMNPENRTKVMAMIANSGELRTVGENNQRREMQEALDSLEELERTPGKSGAIGTRLNWEYMGGMRETPIEGSEAASYLERLKQVKSRLTLPRTKNLRGLGPMSDRDLQMLASSASALETTVNEKDYDRELGNIKKMLQDKLGVAGGTQQRTQGLAPTPPPDNSGTWRWNGTAWVKRQ